MRAGTGLGILTGLAAEARLARSLGHVLAGGGGAAGAMAAAERLVAEGATALLSFGLAGGLDPALAAGAIVVPRAVLVGGRCYACDPALLDALGGASTERLLGGAAVAATVAEKARLHAESGAAAIDLESGALAEAAARHGLPFAVLRAVCDPADRGLPALALAALDGNGRIGLRRSLAAVLAQPGQVPALLILARDAARARRSLVRRVREFRGGLLVG